jgi:nucleoside-diphosphate-sugar epimerase
MTKILLVGKRGFLAQRAYLSLGLSYRVDAYSQLDAGDALLNGEYSHIVWTSSQTDYGATEGDVFFNNTNPLLEFFETTKNGPKIPHITYISSAAVEGGYGFGPWDEDDVSPNQVYSCSKYAAESILQTYYRQGRIENLWILRPCAFIGEGSHHGLVKDALEKASSANAVIEAYGKYPGSIKPLIHVDDVVSAIKFSLKKYNCGTSQVVNVTNDDSISVHAVYRQICERLKVEKLLRWVPTPWTEISTSVRYENKRLSNLGWTPAYDSSIKALDRAIDEFLKAKTIKS